MEKTPNGIEYEWFTSTTNEVNCILYAIIDTHKEEEDVLYAVKWIKQNIRIIDTVQVRWKKADDDGHMPVRIPSSVIIKNLNVEIGKLKSYVTELEERIQKSESLSPQERKEISKDKVAKEQEVTIKEQQALIKKLRKESEQLIIKLNLKNEHQGINGVST